MITDRSLEQLIEELPFVHSDRNYWFVRTNGGRYFGDFYKSGFIAMGYDRINPSDIKEVAHDKLEGYIPILGAKVFRAYKKEIRPNYVASQLYNFTHRIKRNDVVIIPHYHSSELAFGSVRESNVYVERIRTDDPEICTYRKRKKVRWVKVVRRDDLDPRLYKLMYSQHTITEANLYSEYIDRIINSVYIKDDKAYLILDVKTSESIKAINLFEMGYDLLSLFDNFCEEQNLGYDSKNINIKLNVQSPGVIELSSVVVEAIIIFGLLCVGLSGGEVDFKVSEQVHIKFKTPGILKAISLFLNNKQRRELIEQMIDLKISNPKELVELIQKQEKE